MKPYTADAEAAFTAASESGDLARIDAASARIDELDEARPVASLHGAALWYAERGLHVFPLQPSSKIPFKGSRGFKDATTYHGQINRWWNDWPDANIGIATGHLVDVVDIDGPAGQKSRATHWEMFEALTVLGKVSTPRPGGGHLYVPATGLSNKAGLLPGIDYRSGGGYVVAPPSVTEQGSYRWLVPIDTTALGA